MQGGSDWAQGVDSIFQFEGPESSHQLKTSFASGGVFELVAQVENRLGNKGDD